MFDPGAAAQNGSVSYTLDQVGNRTNRISQVAAFNSQLGVTFNSRDQLPADTYDANGNTTLSLGVTTQDVYDFEDRLILRYRADGTSVIVSYDADGVRRQKAVFDLNSSLIRATGYLSDTNNLTGYAQVLEEYTNTYSGPGTGSTATVYTYGSNLISQSVSNPNSPASSTISYFGFDGLGSVRQLTNASGVITDTWDYDAFGNLLSRTGTTANNYLYRGEQSDPDLGMYYLRARFYNQGTGRFWNQDSYEGSSGDPASLHKYLYANADPLGFRDPGGRMTMAEVMVDTAIVGLISIIAVPQVFEMGMTAARTLIAAGLEGAEKLKDGISGQIVALTLAYETMKANEKAKARPIAQLRNDPSQGKAVIGESMSRVIPAAIAFRGETFEPVTFFGSTLPDFPLNSQGDFNLWMWANRAWIRSVMVRELLIVDIGRDETKVFLGWNISPFYEMERQETSGYFLKVNESWPPSLIPL